MCMEIMIFLEIWISHRNHDCHAQHIFDEQQDFHENLIFMGIMISIGKHDFHENKVFHGNYVL